MTAIKISRPGDTWSGVAYTYYNDSREFRTILSLNPGYDIRSFPAPGLPMQVQSLGGINTIGPAAVGSLIQPDANFDLRAGSPVSTTPESIFPWDTAEAFVARRADYVPEAVTDASRLNGFTLDTSQALTGNQSG
jgi:hypothetical protein